MSRKTVALLTVPLVLLLAAAIVVVVLMLQGVVFAGGGIYPAGASQLDLRDKKLTVEQYEAIRAEMPDCRIRWSVPFQGKAVDSDSQTIEVSTLSEEDAALLDYFPKLVILDGRNCADSGCLMQVVQERENLHVLMNVNLEGKVFNQETEVVSLNTLDAQSVQKLEYLPKLSRVEVSGDVDAAFLTQVKKEHPQWKLCADVTLQGVKYPGNMTFAAISDCTTEELRLIDAGLGDLTDLKLLNPQASGLEVQAFKAEHPEIQVSWSKEIGGTSFADDATEVEVRKTTFSDISQARALADYFPQLERFVMYDVGLDNETIAAFRDEARDQFKVVWKLYMGAKCTAMSDDTWFFPTQQRDYYFQNEASYNMRYLEDCIAVDVGDQPNVKNVEWAAYMPHLQFLILAHTNVRDLTPLANCKELSFLELDLDHIVVDLTPLKECTAMENLNLGYAVADHTPLLEMTWLKRLWWCRPTAKASVDLRAALGPVREASKDDPDPDIVEEQKKMSDDELAVAQGKTIFRFGMNSAVGGGWRRMDGYYAMRDALHAEYDKTNWG